MRRCSVKALKRQRVKASERQSVRASEQKIGFYPFLPFL